MVDVSSAPTVHHAATIKLPSKCPCIYANGDWSSLCDGLHEGRVVVRRKVHLAGDVRNWFDFGLVAGSSDTLVGVVCLCRDARLSDVVKCERLGGPCASSCSPAIIRVGSTRHKLLLREGHQLSGGESEVRFDSLGRGEGPAGSAAALVLNRCHDSFLPPVYRFRKRLDEFMVDRSCGSVSKVLQLSVSSMCCMMKSTSHASEFIGMHISPVIYMEPVRMRLVSVMISDDLKVLLEDTLPISHLAFGIRLPKVDQIFVKGVRLSSCKFIMAHAWTCRGANQEDRKNSDHHFQKGEKYKFLAQVNG
mmetsp:Transcript_2970/g.4297  ORF Transcript_2970/g.4297 Transcript_2970/m.4297 type:complete len:305 (-) Transcript_2970:63-977(-)